MAIVCGEGLTVRTYLDGSECTGVAILGSWTPRLNRPAQAQIKTPMDAGNLGDCGSLLKIVLTDGVDDEIVFHGPVLNTETDTDKDQGTTVYNAQDHMELWQHRPVRDDSADFSKPDIIVVNDTGPAILHAMLRNTVDSTSVGGGAPPQFAEGPIFLTLGSFPGGGPSLAGAPVDWPQNIDELFSLLVSTGQLDAVITYTDPGGGVTGTINAFNGDYGTDLSGTIGFYYGTGARNAAAVKWNRDMTQLVNKYQIFGGPQVQTAADPKGEQHWCFNITGDDPGLASPPGGDVQAPYAGGGGNPPGDPGNELGGRRLDSQAAYGVRMKIDIMDAYDDDCIPGFGTPGRDLLRYQWQTYSWMAAMPREIIHITPTPDAGIGCFHIGDLIHVEASSEVRGGFSGAQRVMEYTVSWEGTPSVLTLSEIQTSTDGEVAS